MSPIKACQGIVAFWRYHPALFYGCGLLIGCYGALYSFSTLYVPFLCLWIPFLGAALYSKQSDYLWYLVVPFFLVLTGAFYTSISLRFPTVPEEGISGTIRLTLTQVSWRRSFFGPRWVYHGQIEQFFREGSPDPLPTPFRFMMTLPVSQETEQARPLAYGSYWVQGRVDSKSPGCYRLRVKKSAIWQPVPFTWSWAENRYRWKQNAQSWIKRQFSEPLSGIFLAGLITGEFDEEWLRQQFGRFGLLHLLAISGFHFTVVATFLRFFLRLLFARAVALPLLLLGLGGYAFFLGPQPSILRAWMMCSFVIAGEWVGKSTNSLNLLGATLMVLIAYDPGLVSEMSFQLSFAITSAILLFMPICRFLMDLCLPSRTLSEVQEMGVFSQIGHCVVVFLKGAMALTLAVNVVGIPLTLYYFQEFPWLSLLYNLFFPLLATLSLVLLLAGILLSPIPYIGGLLHYGNEFFTGILLRIVYQMPPQVDRYWKLEIEDPIKIGSFFALMLLAAVIWHSRSNPEVLEERIVLL